MQTGRGSTFVFSQSYLCAETVERNHVISKLKGVSACLTHKEPGSQSSLLLQLTSLETWCKFLGPGSLPVKGAEF